MVSAQGGCAAGPLQRPVFSPFARRMAARAAVESKRTPIKSRRAGSGCILLHLCQRTHMFTVQPFHGQMARTPATGFVARCPSGIPVRGRLWRLHGPAGSSALSPARTTLLGPGTLSTRMPVGPRLAGQQTRAVLVGHWRWQARTRRTPGRRARQAGRGRPLRLVVKSGPVCYSAKV